MGVALLHLAAHAGVGAQQVARAREQVEEVELAGARLERLVVGDQRSQLVVEAGGEVGLGRVDDLRERGADLVAPCVDVAARAS